MGFMNADIYYPSQCTLGEGPIWDHRHNELVWVDIDEQKILFLKEGATQAQTFIFDQKVGFVVLGSHSDYIIALADGLYRFNRVSKALKKIAWTGEHLTSLRWNDGKCAPDGSIWGGTMDLHHKLHQGGLYRLDRSMNLTKCLSSVSISNGLAWNSDLKRMYYIDSPTRSVQVFDYESGRAHLGSPAETFKIPVDMGYPDGMTIDEDGMLWIAHWDGYCIGRWHPETGQLLTKVAIPAPRVTSCIFGDKSRSRLYITTARKGLTDEQLRKYPHSGSIFIFDTNTTGREAQVFDKIH